MCPSKSVELALAQRTRARRRARSGIVLLALSAVATLPAPAAADTFSSPSVDACWTQSYPGGSCESTSELHVGARVDGQFDTSFVKWDLTGIESDSVIAEATLRLYVSGASGNNSSDLAVHPMTTDWDSGAGVPQGNIPSGYFGPEVGRSSLPTPSGWIELDVGDTVRDWVEGTVPNYGFGLHLPDAVADDDFVGVISAWSLVIDYAAPCQSSDPFAAAQASSESPVHAWNEQLLTRIRDVSTTEPIRQSPTWISRAAAMLNIGIYDTLNSVFFAKLEAIATGTPTDDVCGWESYVTLAETPPSTNANLAAGYAAKAILTALYPDKSTQIAAAFNTIHNTPSFNADASKLGNYVANQVLALRGSDGANAAMSYTPALTTPGAWRPSPFGTGASPGTCTAVTPQWGNVTPFALTSGSQFRDPGPGLYTSYASLLPTSYYATHVNEVKQSGARNAPSFYRNADKTQAAWFWANDLDGTYKPPGQLIEHTKLVVQTQPAAQSSGDPRDFFHTWSRQGIRVARLYAEVSIAMADSGIASWDQKFNTALDLWRPVDAIRQAHTDGNASTIADAAWEPLSQTVAGEQFSPCFPAYGSGHATFGGAWSGVMDNEFAHDVAHTNPFPLELTTDDPHAVGVERTFVNFYQAAEENAVSRVWLGVHFRFDAEVGLRTGRSIAEHVGDTKLRAEQECPGWSCAVPIP